jgi:hypothetical protein
MLGSSPKTQRCYRGSDLGRIFFVGMSAAAGMTDRNVFNAMPRALRRSDISQCDYPPPLKLKASYLVKRASDRGLRDPL